MSDVPFHQTRIGQRFYEHTLPRLVEEVAMLNERLAALAEAVERQEEETGDEGQRPPGPPSAPCSAV